ncbi:hypothetical protein FRN05_05515 [Salmonella enterica subsp. enterica]|nr:hypothetical protein [Salmonella enterica subsp. enterica]ECK7389101.1 hypothetical protein [Salmonella enterica subsp. enterica serovar Meleagridis]EDM9769332.1 hypothetical protein [Salmonella enterica subsp. enterica serovar Corvallis]EDR6869137.1 hypothetical protein [Salmonella enterica subsp. enterica]EDW6361826.1 hypothetical protein [Salmonella enterica subsp. enterica]
MGRRMNIKLPCWMNKGEPQKLAAACKRFWLWLDAWLRWPLQQFDALTCNETILFLLAWQRDVTRLSAEPLDLFRRRVNYAFINAQDAGSTAGFARIFERLEIGFVGINERVDGIDWDVILLDLTDRQISEHGDLLREIVRQYGRTCRRYRFQSLTSTPINIQAGSVHNDYVCHAASLIRE